jgi:hypothetical protein
MGEFTCVAARMSQRYTYGADASMPSGGNLHSQHIGAVPQRSLMPSIHNLLQLQ